MGGGIEQQRKGCFRVWVGLASVACSVAPRQGGRGSERVIGDAGRGERERSAGWVVAPPPSHAAGRTGGWGGEAKPHRDRHGGSTSSTAAACRPRACRDRTAARTSTSARGVRNCKAHTKVRPPWTALSRARRRFACWCRYVYVRLVASPRIVPACVICPRDGA